MGDVDNPHLRRWLSKRLEKQHLVAHDCEINHARIGRE